MATTEQPRHVVEAVYENGVFRPLTPLGEPIKEGKKVRRSIDAALSPEEMLRLATSVYEGLSEEEIAEIEKIALDRSDFFGSRKKP
jgi:predicted DNA-binding antitoxin AbrB/MazE fold protein